jgi:AcrR family transcriptional regulator
MGRRSDHSREELKDLALRAAKDIVLTEGASALSTRKVAAAMGYTAGSLYLVFENLEALILEMNGATLDALQLTLRDTGQRYPDVTTSLTALAEAYVQFAYEHWPLWSLIFERPRPLAPPAWYTERIQQIFLFVEERLQQVAPERSAAEIHLAAQAVWGGVHGACSFGMTRRLDESSLAGARRAAVALVTIFVTGLQQQSISDLAAVKD